MLEPILALVAPLVSLLAPAIQFVVGVLSVMIQIVVEVITWLVKLATGSEEAQAQVVAAWNNVLSFFGTIGAAIGGFFSGAVTWLVEAGQNIIQGLIDGITGAVDGLFGFINDIGANIADTFASVLGIHSPSRVFAAFGKNVIAGLENGLSSSNSLNAIMGGLSAQVTDSFNVPIGSLITATDAPRSGTVAPGQQINVNVTQNYPTTRDPIKMMKADAESVLAGIWN